MENRRFHTIPSAEYQPVKKYFTNPGGGGEKESKKKYRNPPQNQSARNVKLLFSFEMYVNGVIYG